MRLVGSDNGLKEIQLGDGGRVVPRHKDGTFHVPTGVGKELLSTGDFAVAGTNFRSAKCYPCLNCGFRAVFPKCGKCGTDNNPAED